MRSLAARIAPAIGVCLVLPAPSTAQGRAVRTTVIVELLTDSTASPLDSQKWGRAFQELGINARIRRGAFSEKPSIRESVKGGTRIVTLVGRLDARGKVTFKGRTFERGASAGLKKWIEELKVYGADGSPDGKPLWGLTEVQFAALHAALSKKIAVEDNEVDLFRAVRQLATPTKYPLLITDETSKWLQSEFDGPIVTRKSLPADMATGTALAMLINDYGLGLRPLRKPSGEIELVIDPLTVTMDVWPVGWEPKLSPLKTAPAAMKLVDVDFQDIALPDLFAAVEEQSTLPILIDHYRIEGFSIDLKSLTASIPSKRLTWLRVLSTATSRHLLRSRLKVDEGGRPFVWITTASPRRSPATPSR